MRNGTRGFFLPCFCTAVFLLLLTFHAGLSAKTYIHKPSAVGNDYYIVFPKAAYGNQNVEALVNSAAPQNIIVTKPGGSQKDTFALSAPNTVQVINSMFHVEDKSEALDSHGAAHIQSSSPISVIGQFGTTGISGTYNALPVTAWGTEYVVLNEPEGENSGYTGYFPQVFSVPQVTIIGSQNGTKIDITLPSQVHTAQNKAGTFTITLNAGDVYYFTDAADPNAVNRVENTCLTPAGDFTGARIVSEDPLKPIGVIVSQSHTSEPCGDNECGDFGMEWLPPISGWDTAYIITPSVPHGGNNPGQGELLRVTFAEDNTTLYTEDANGRTSIGTFNAGDPLFIGNPIIEPYVLSADRPFLTCEITTKPQSCLVGNRGGSANFTFSMVFMPGVDEWSDFTPFCTADQAAFSQANIYFRQADEKKLYVNGVPLLLLSPVVNKIPGTPYAYLATPLGSNMYYEIRGDSGATAGGTLFGYGAGRFSANNGNGNTHTLDPEMVKSFAHPIGINNIPVESQDSMPPVMTVAQSSGCGKWFITVSDSTTAETLNTGIYSILLAENSAPDSSFNVQFHAIPSFQYGSQSVTFEVDVRNLASSAAAALHIRDGAGNELDTTLFYDGLVVSATPQLLDAGVTRDAFNGTILLQNASNVPVSFFELKLQSGKYWKIVPPTPVVSDSTPLTFKPGESNTVHVMFSAPVSAIYECLADTLIVKTCREFPIASMNACLLKPAIYASDHDFGCMNTDTLNLGGDTVVTQRTAKGVFVVSTGGDTLHVTNAQIVGLNTSNPAADFAILGYYDAMQNAAVNLPVAMPPGDTLFVIVRGHPHHFGDIYGAIAYTDDANHNQKDTSFLHICGEKPVIITTSVDYGTRLYATTKDSFAVVKNIGQSAFTVERFAPFGPDSAYFVAYPFGQGYIDPTTHVYIQYPDTMIVLGPIGSAGDTARYPYRFYAWKLGLNVDSIEIQNSSGAEPDIALLANVVQPHVWAWSGCLADTLRTGDTATAVVQMGNTGTDVLTVDTVSIGGPNPANWSISGIENTTTVQSVSVPFTLQPGDRASVRLLYTATQNGRPDETVSFSGHDALGRHANDSLVSLYGWGVFPYDTTVRIVDCALSGVNEHVSIPSEIMLSQNYPNPFSTVTTFTFTSSISAQYYIDIYNSLGERIAVLPTMEMQPGRYTAAWDASGWASGVYYYRVSAGVNNNSVDKIRSFLLIR